MPCHGFTKISTAYDQDFKKANLELQTADFDSFREILNEHNLEAKLESTLNVDTNVQQDTDALFSAADQSILNKVICIRLAEHSCKILSENVNASLENSKEQVIF